ncbi:hypothetical protein N9966_00925 [bacterium]|jgi:hypothetical protein|nr:hypothetical protein [bacterium]
MMDERLIDAIRAKYQWEMKDSVSKINLELTNPSEDSSEKIDSLVDFFSRTKEKASYFEAIIKNIKGEED